MNTLNNKSVILDLDIKNDNYDFSCNIASELSKSEIELQMIDTRITETIAELKKLTPECDKLDYILAATSGVICGVIDVFLVGKPGESPLGDITDKWFEDRTKDFAKLFGWDGNGTSSSAISFLEKNFKVPYDQRGAGDAGSAIFNLTPEKKIAHNVHPVLRWMMDNIFIRRDPAVNIKMDKEKSTEKIDGSVATVMALDRAIRCGCETADIVYDSREMILL